MCGSEDLKGFLTEQDMDFEKRKIDSYQQFPHLQQQSVSQQAYSTVSSYFAYASSYVWSSSKGQRKESFG